MRDRRGRTRSVFDVGDQDEVRFREAARLRSAKLTAEPHEWQTGPGTHAHS